MNSSYNVLHVNDCGGVAINLIKGMRDLGHQADLYLPTIGTYNANKLTRIMLPLTRTRESFHLQQLYRNGGYNVLHIHYATLAYLALLTGLPYYLHCHGSDLRRDLQMPLRGMLVKLALRKARKVFYVTPELWDYIKDIRPDAIFQPNPIDLDAFLPRSKPITGPSAGVFCISKLDHFKGLETQVEAIELLWREKPNVKVTMFNFGNAVHLVQPFFERHQNDPRLTLLPSVQHAEIINLIQNHTAVLGHLSFEYGSLSLSELESLACGKPIVCAFRFPQAYITPPPVMAVFDAENAKACLLRALEDVEIQQYALDFGPAWVRQNHELKHIAHTVLKHYNAF